MNGVLEYGDQVLLSWGLAEIRGTIIEIYGRSPRQHVVVQLTPELSGYIVDEPTTVSLPIDLVRPAQNVA
jgi:hypothetical protein